MKISLIILSFIFVYFVSAFVMDDLSWLINLQNPRDRFAGVFTMLSGVALTYMVSVMMMKDNA